MTVPAAPPFHLFFPFPHTMSQPPKSQKEEKFDFTLDEVRAWGGDRLYEEAMSQYIDKDAVSDVFWCDGVGGAEILHAGRRLRTAFRTVPGSRGLVSNLCPCATSQRDGKMCVHMMAAAIALAKEPAKARKRRIAEKRAAAESAPVPEQAPASAAHPPKAAEPQAVPPRTSIAEAAKNAAIAVARARAEAEEQAAAKNAIRGGGPGRISRTAAPRLPGASHRPDGGPRIRFYIPADWETRYRAAGKVPLAISVSPDDTPRPRSLRDIVTRKNSADPVLRAFDPTPEEDDLLFTFESLFPLNGPSAIGRNIPLDGKAFFAALDRFGEDGIPIHLAGPVPAGTDRTIFVHPSSHAVHSVLSVSLDAASGELGLTLETDVPDLPPGTPKARYLVYRDAADWRADRAFAIFGSQMFPLKHVVPGAYGDVYDRDCYVLHRREAIAFIRREYRGETRMAGTLKPLRDIMQEDFRSAVDESLFTIKLGVPRFVLEAAGSPASVSLALKAVYSGLPSSEAAPDGSPVAAAAPITVDVVSSNTAQDFTIPDPDDNFLYYARNRPAENAALARLAARGLADPRVPPQPARGAAIPPPAPDARPDAATAPEFDIPNIVGDQKVLEFLATTVPILRRNGWEVVLDDALRSYDSTLTRVAPRVTVRDLPGENAFEISYVLASEDGSIELPESLVVVPPAPRPQIRTGPGRPAKEVPRPAPPSFVQWNGENVYFDRSAIEELNTVLEECTAPGSRHKGKTAPPPGAPRVVLSVYTYYVKSRMDELAASGVKIVSAPEAWLRDADLETARAELKPVPLQEPLRSLLRPYQAVGVAWLRSLEIKGRGGILADEMGLGKTIQTLAWLSLSRFSPVSQGRPALVVCPTSLVHNWLHEARHFTPFLKSIAITGSQRHEEFGKIPESDVVITSYALIRRDVEIYRKMRLSAIVLDEAQNIKNRNTQNARSVKSLDPTASRLVVTGTPMENSVADVWSIMDFLQPGYLGPYERFRREWEEKFLLPASDERHVATAKHLGEKIAPFLLRRLKKSVAKELPPKTTRISWCKLSDDQRRAYDMMLGEARARVTGAVRENGFEKSRMIILTVLLRLRQICCHLSLLGKDNPFPRSKDPSGKLEQLFQIIDDATGAGHRILVFSQFVEMLHIIRDAVSERGMPFCYLDGSSKDRLQEVQRFNSDPSIPVFLISLKAGGSGLNLTGADEVVHFDPWWNPAVEDQATDRAHRIGQKNHVNAFRLIAEDTIESRVLDMQRRKRTIMKSVGLGDDAQTISKLTWADVQKLLDIA